jgi:alcohol dehydrogenase (cytochrome c)
MNRFIALTVAGIVAAAGAQANVTEEMIANDRASTGDVLTNGMGRDLQRYSPLDILNKDNVSRSGHSRWAAKSSAGRKPSRWSMTA